jgi:predicted amidophosphoribosyltransferase
MFLFLFLLFIGSLIFLFVVIKIGRDVTSSPKICPACDRQFRKVGYSLKCPYCRTKLGKKQSGELFIKH